MISYSFKNEVCNFSIFEEDESIVEIRFNTKEFYHDSPTELILETKKQIEEYLFGKRTEFSFKYRITGSPFQIKVLDEMKKIPYGKTISYSDLAIKAGFNKAARAVGSVCKNNKLPLLFPCHRVIKSNGDIGQFSGGISLKKLFLNIEKRL